MARKMSEDHKEALAKGRTQGRIVREYLTAVNQSGKPGRKLDKPTIEKRIPELQRQIDEESDPATRLDLIQRRLDLEERLATFSDGPDLEALEKAFAEVAVEYADRRGISYMAWREAGVSAAALKRAGVRRTRRTTPN